MKNGQKTSIIFFEGSRESRGGGSVPCGKGFGKDSSTIVIILGTL